MRCPYCGKENAEDSSFCSQCDAALLLGDRTPSLGPYRIKAKLGEGGMGAVYLADDMQLEREVALKVLHPQLLKHKHFLERFRREARMHAKLIHPNIVTLLSLYEDEEHLALVMEMVHGQDLKQYLRQHPRVDLKEVERISLAILHGLGAAHAVGLVHRDLKPANVLLGDDGSIKLTDFGLAKPKHGDEDLTESGATVGSYRYMAPEQITNQPVDARTDLYAFGILLYQMCTGRLPFEASSGGGGEFEIMEKQVRHMPQPPHEVNPTLPRALSELIMVLLAKEPGRRPASCEEVVRMLRFALRQAETASWEQMEHIPQNNLEIAKGLVLAYGRKLGRSLLGLFMRAKHHLWHLPAQWLERHLHTLEARLPARMMERLPQGWPRLFALGAPAAVLLLLGLWLAWPTTPPPPSQAIVEETKGEKTAEPAAPKAAKQEIKVVPTQEKAAAKATAREEASKEEITAKATARKESAHAEAPKKAVKARPAVAKAKKPEKPGTPRRQQQRAITFRVGHRVIRSDLSKVDAKSRHEFRGGEHVYFPELADYKWKKSIRAYKKGWVRLILNKPQPVSTIVIRRASVGDADFQNGEIVLQVRDELGRVYTLLQRRDKDIDHAVAIRIDRTKVHKVAGVRLRFKTPEPLTVGPIDLLP